MLSFSHNDQQREQRIQEFTGQLPFQPIIIENKPRRKSKSPRRKVLMKTVTGKPVSASHTKSTQKLSQTRQADKPWYESGKMTGGLFDNKLRKNELMQEQRRIHKKSVRGETRELQYVQEPIKIVQNKRLAVETKDKNQKAKNEIEHLKRLIEREREEKAKSDKIFQQQQLKLQKERNQLKKIQKQINKVTAPFKQTRKADDSGVYKPYKQHDIPTYQPETNEVIKQRIDSNQQRLNHLIKTKDRLSSQNNPLNYTPTLIPLLSKASYKIISTHISTLTQLLIDDMLLEEVLVLQQLQEKEQNKRKIQKRMNVVQDYMELVHELVRENDEIEHRLGRYDRVDLPNWYKPDLYKPMEKITETTHKFEDQEILVKISDKDMDAILKAKRNFMSYIKYRDEYETEHLHKFTEATEELISEMLTRMVEELERDTGDFVDLVFRNEFR